jgi:hemerythrin-like domain-containing protein
MDIVDALVGEHGVLGAECEDLEGLVALASSLAEVRAQTALLASGLQSHAQVEDELLFTALEPSLGASSPVLQGMRMMHEDIDRGLARAVQARDLAEIRDALLGVLDLTRQHFMGEEQVVFPLARDTLPLAIREHLGSQWADRRGISRLAIGS